jgi:hypothetical protein
MILLVSTQADANHKPLFIRCIEPSPKPKCCEAMSDSGGSNPISYFWFGTHGSFDPQFTEVNFTEFHCDTTFNVTANLNNEVDGGPWKATERSAAEVLSFSVASTCDDIWH